MHACVYVHMHICICMCARACGSLCMFACMYMSMCVCVCVHSQIGIQGSTYCLVSEGYPSLQKVPDCLSGVEILGSRAECIGVHL